MKSSKKAHDKPGRRPQSGNSDVETPGWTLMTTMHLAALTVLMELVNRDLDMCTAGLPSLSNSMASAKPTIELVGEWLMVQYRLVLLV